VECYVLAMLVDVTDGTDRGDASTLAWYISMNS
jgi:hypothetical protein